MQKQRSASAKESIKNLLASTKKKRDFQRVQCVWLRLEFNMKANLVSQITQLKPGTVRKIWSDYFNQGEESLLSKDRGGRRNFHLSKEEESMLLSPFFKRAEKNDMLVVEEIKQAYENMIGKQVPKSTIYRLLSRHGWNRKTGKKKSETPQSDQPQGLYEYWIEGCSQALHPDKTGNISQQWLNNTLNSMTQFPQK